MNVSDKLIFVNIKNSYEAMMNNDKKHPLFRESLYDCTVKFWNIDAKKAEAATHILGCYKGEVIEVVRITKPFSVVHGGELSGRKIFEGVEEPDSPYMSINLHDLFDSLANFRVKYWNL